jgi:excisionase family DNA binding protein
MTIELKDKLYTSTEVANVLGVSLRSVYRYLDEGKLDADVKTATGRHRFSKQNILDFLYPQGDKKSTSEDVSTTVQKSPVKKVTSAPKVEEVELEDTSDELEDIDLLSDDTEELTVDEDEVAPAIEQEEDSSVDWLAKFRAAAEKYREEQTMKTAEVETVTETNTTTMPEPEETASVVETTDVFTQEYEEEPEEKTEYYYLSGVGGLKEIAQSLDKAAKKASVDYAFTLDAGLSLFKPIRPFSVIHAYVKSSDRDYFEKALKLTEVSKSSAQLCLYISDDKDVYKNKREMYGLNVVSRDKLRNDLISAGEKDLVSELDTIA